MSNRAIVTPIIVAAELIDAAVNPDWVIRLVNNEYDERVISRGKNKNGPGEAFASNTQKKDKRNVECYNCHKLGHYNSDCWAKGGVKEGQRPPRGTDYQNSDNRNNRGRNDNSNNSWNGRSGNDDRCNNNFNNDNENTASADIELRATIDLLDEDISDTSTPTLPTPLATSITSPKSKSNVNDSGACYTSLLRSL